MTAIGEMQRVSVVTTVAKGIALVWYCRTPRGWRRFPALFEKEHGKVIARPGWVKDDGKEQHYRDGRYQIRSYIGGKQVFTNIEATHPRDVAIEFNSAVKAAQPTRFRVANERKTHVMLNKAVMAYLARLEKANKPEAHEQAKQTLNALLEHGCKGVLLTREINEDHLLAHYEWLRTSGCKRMTRSGERAGCSERTIHNKHTRIRSFLIWSKVDTGLMRGLLKKPHGKEVDTYTAGEVAAIRKAAIDYAPEMSLVIEMGLMLGLREQELMYAMWSDVKWENSVFRVTSKPDLGFTIKGRKERTIPIPAELMATLKKQRAKRPNSKYIIGTAKDTPNTHLLRALKRIAHKAGLDCGECSACLRPVHDLDRSEGRQTGCYKWALHKLRRTFGTSLLREGFDIATVQQYAGWEDLKTAMRYLKAAQATAKETHARVNAVRWGA